MPNLTLREAPAPGDDRADSAGSLTQKAPSVTPLLVPADVAGQLCGRSEASWWRDHAAGRIPAPVKLGGRTLWRADELRRWVEAGCPARAVWQALEQSRRK